MARLGFSERVRVAAVRARGLHRQAATRMLGSGLSPWRRGEDALRALVIVPPVLRSRDASFWLELDSGHFGLSGRTVSIEGCSPFAVAHADPVFQRELYGFAWLRHLDGCGEDAAAGVARRLVLDGMAGRRLRGPAAETAVRARRILSLIAHSPFVLDGADGAEYGAIGRALAADIWALSRSWRTSEDHRSRMLAVTALVTANLVMSGRERELAAAHGALGAEISRQILPDGGHVSRNPAVIMDLLLDWLPLKSCYDALKRPPPEAFVLTLPRMLTMLRWLKLGDAGLARFNGAGRPDPSELATLAAYDDRPLPGWGIAPASRYARLDAGSTVVLVDGGPPPPLMASGAAHAGCLSFEMSSQRRLVVVNSGAPAPADVAWLAAARATASHSTVSIAEQSSARLVRHESLEAILGATPLQDPATAKAQVDAHEGGVKFSGWHDGYLQRLGLNHHRVLDLAKDGTALSGIERLETKGGQDRLRRDVPFAVHFHLHPDTRTERDGLSAVALHLSDGQIWHFEAPGADVSIEESFHFAGHAGPRPSAQIVIRGATAGLTELRWCLRMRERDRTS